MAQKIDSHQFDNGLVLVCETMDWLESAAFSVSLPNGAAYDPTDRLGLASITCEMIQRGCGDFDSRGFVEQLDRLGADRASSVTQAHTSFAASVLSESLPAILKLFTAVLRKPHIPEDQVEDARMVCLQELASLEDELFQRTMNTLREMAYPAPWGRIALGTKECVEQISVDDIRSYHAERYGPAGTILSVAGKVDFEEIRLLVGDLLGDWDGNQPLEFAESRSSQTYKHIAHDSSQTHIGVAFDSVPYKHDDYFLSRGAIGALSDGMSSRLFTEVRENRGLCYTVFASCHSLKHFGRVLGYAGTSSERAQETLDVMLAEIRKLAGGINESELERVKARTKSAVIMQQESSSARANALSGDWYHLGFVRTVAELNRLIDGLSVDRINEYLEANPPDNFTVVTLGQNPLEVSVELS